MRVGQGINFEKAKQENARMDLAYIFQLCDWPHRKPRNAYDDWKSRPPPPFGRCVMSHCIFAVLVNVAGKLLGMPVNN